MTTAYSYVRFSSARQMHGDSLRRQSAAPEEYAAEHGLTLDQTLNMKDLGVSAFDGSNVKKGALGAFLKAVESGLVAPGSFLLVESIDRLSRDQVLNALAVFMEIIQSDITIVTLNDRMKYSKESIGQHYGPLLMSITLMAQAHDESFRKSKRLIASWQNKVSQVKHKKLTARCGGWMRLRDDRSAFDLIPDRTEVVKEIITMSLNGMGQSVIVRKLNERKIKSWTGGDGWHTSTIAKILNNTALYGEFQPQMTIDGVLQPYGDPVADYFPALITKDQFTALKAVRTQRQFGLTGRKGASVANLISGLGRCGYCGSSMVLIGNKKRVPIDGDETVKMVIRKSLVCDNGRRGIQCYAVRWNYYDFEKSFLTYCRGLGLRELLDSVKNDVTERQKTKSLQDQLALATASIEDCQRRLQKLQLAIEDGDAPKALIARMLELETEMAAATERESLLKSEINNRLIDADMNERNVDEIQTIIDEMPKMAGEELYTFRSALAEKIRKLIREVTFYPAGRLYTAAEIENIRVDLRSDGFDEKRIADHLSQYRTEPARVVGRYASVKSYDRSFVIRGRTTGVHILRPTYEDPTRLNQEILAVPGNYVVEKS